MTSPTVQSTNNRGETMARIAELVGPKGVVRPEDAAPYLADQRGLYRSQAALVVRPSTVHEVSEIVKLCAAARIPIVPQGGNTGLVGGTVAGENELLLNLGRLNRIRSVDPLNNTLTAEAGCVLADIQAAADEADRLFPLTMASEGSCQIGGALSTNAGGTAVLRYGTARDLVLGLEVVLADGRVLDVMTGLRKDNTGYDLKQLFLGAEGTLGIITAAVLKLFPKPREIATAVVALRDLEAAPELLARARAVSNDSVIAFELLSGFALSLVLRHIPGAANPLSGRFDQLALIEMATADADAGLGERFERLLDAALSEGLIRDAAVALNDTQRQAFWRLRESLPEAQKREGASIKHDVAVPVSAVPAFIASASEAVELEMHGIRVVAFGHAGDGNIHFNLTKPVGMEDAVFLARWMHFNRIVHDIVRQFGGTISAEHGIGRLKREELVRTASPLEIEVMRRLKVALDPLGLLNPGKIF